MAATGMFFLLQTVKWLLNYFMEMHQYGGKHKTQYKPIVNFNGEKTENSLFYATMASNVLSASDFLMIATACCISYGIDSIFVTNVTDLWLFSINQGYNFSVLENIFLMLHILCIATRNVLHLQFYFNLITEKYIYISRGFMNPGLCWMFDQNKMRHFSWKKNPHVIPETFEFN